MFTLTYKKNGEFVIYGAGYSLANGKYYLTKEIVNEIYVYQNENLVQLKVPRAPGPFRNLLHRNKTQWKTNLFK